jgi:hypothetical protein
LTTLTVRCPDLGPGEPRSPESAEREARHVAFGRLLLRGYHAKMTEAERADREEFIVKGCYLMRNPVPGAGSQFRLWNLRPTSE